MRLHRIRRGVVLAAIVTAVVLAVPGSRWLAPPPVEAQFDNAWCRVDVTVENRLRRVRGQVNTECGECRLLWCHGSPWGNWRYNRKLWIGA